MTNLPEQESDLNPEFWDLFQRRHELPLESRRELTERLIRHGLMSREKAEEVVIPAPEDPETGQTPILPPDPSGEDADEAILAFMNRPFDV